MPRPTLAQSLVGMVALTALLGAGCDQWNPRGKRPRAPSVAAAPERTRVAPATGAAGAPAGNAGSGGAPGVAIELQGGRECERGDVQDVRRRQRCNRLSGLRFPTRRRRNDDGAGHHVRETTDASGHVCHTCSDQTGKIIKTDCPDGLSGSGGGAGSGGSTGTGTCTSIDDGGPASCKDPATWKQYGIDRCGQQKLTLTDLKLLTMCAGGYSSGHLRLLRIARACCAGSEPLANAHQQMSVTRG